MTNPNDSVTSNGHLARKKLIAQRGVIKRKITCTFKLIEKDSSVDNFSNCTESIKNMLKDIAKLDTKINDSFCADEGSEEISEEFSSELDSQTSYSSSVMNQLSALSHKPESDSGTKSTVSESMSSCKLKLPELKCEPFAGEGTSFLEFHVFISQYNNIIGLRSDISKAMKLTYLKTYLKGYALKLVQHLQVNDINYDVALELLNSEFMNKPSIVDDLLKKLLELKPKFDHSYLETKIFINEVRCILSDLKVYEYDFLTDKAGNLLISHIVFSKLPMPFRQELVRKTNNNFPSVQDIFNNYVEIVRILNLRQTKSPINVQTPVAAETRHDFSSRNVNRSVTVGNPEQKTGEGKHGSKLCKFCTSTGHSMLSCSRYSSYQDRKRRCEELGVCSSCTSKQHQSDGCNRPLDFACVICKSKKHISALCSKFTPRVSSNFCTNSVNDSGQTYLLPYVTINVAAGKSNTSVKCLLDTGSQRSYIGSNVLERLGVNPNSKSSLLINTFIDSDYKDFAEAAVTVKFNSDKFLLPFLVNDEFNLALNIDGLTVARDNISKEFTLNSECDSDFVNLEGLIGIDALQYIGKIESIQCLSGRAFKFSSGIVPYGNIDNFLNNDQLATKYSKNRPENIVSGSVVNYVLNPVKSYFDPISPVCDSVIEGNLDRMFSAESIGLSEEYSDYDEQKVSEFSSGIKLENGKYSVELPWHDNISEVKSNYNVSLAVLNRVLLDLDKKNLYDKYNDVLLDQLGEGVIEEFQLTDANINEHIWIPHRPVIRTADNVTTKLRIVLNCSIKIGNAPSLNEAAYAGVDLMSDLIGLLLKIRENDYLVMSDIKKAFLMINLSKESDKNKFSILWKNKEGKLVAYRYRTIVFGYVTSPFILNYIIKHHVSSYPKDECSYVLSNNMYVDNLFFTGNNLTELETLYKDCYQRMMDAGFQLRSWCSNSKDLNDKFVSDEISSSPDNVCEKVLGYDYFPKLDEIKLNEFDINNPEILTKRTILSYIARIFDPIGFCLPVTVKAKLFMREIWKSKVNWDEQISDSLKSTWFKIKSDLDSLQSLSFPRKAFDGNCSLYVLCDSSKELYGFTCYLQNQNGCNLIFAKAKTTPLKSKSLPTLELMAAHLALKCLPTILSPLKKNITDITVAVDAQVALSWILTGNVKTKNICAKNRVKDIGKLRDVIKTEFGIDCKFKYISTDLNSADLLTRGVSFSEFSSRRDFWLHGPAFLRVHPVIWPEKPLGCLSECSKALTMNAATSSATHSSGSIFDLEKFSSADLTFRVTGMVLRAIDKFRRRDLKSKVEYVDMAKRYWLTVEQRKYFYEEFNFLEGKQPVDAPVLVKNLNLFIDKDNLIRSKGRLSKCTSVSYDLNNPILLPKNSILTRLLVSNAHMFCKHLGTTPTLTALRKSGFWVPKGRVVVRSVLRKCIICKKLNAHSFRYPRPNDYIADKVNLINPFDHTGIDYTGNITVKFGDELRKMYILLFTCMSVRAVHLELMPDMSTKSFLFAFIKFCNRYTIPTKIYSDNASTFLQSIGILAESEIENEFTDFLVKNSIRHVRIPLYSAWVGSAWERMIGVIKSCLYKSIGRKRVDYFEFISLLSDIQEAVNNRPLTYRCDNELLDSITPNSFLKHSIGRSILLDGTAGSELVLPNRKDIVQSLEKREQFFQKFREMFYEEYLISLRESGRDLHQTEWENVISPGDIVLVSAPNQARHCWKMGRVQEVLPGNDGVVRCVKISRSDRTEGVYSINMLYPLELSVTPSICPKPAVASNSIVKRPRRAAATKCLAKLKNGN